MLDPHEMLRQVRWRITHMDPVGGPNMIWTMVAGGDSRGVGMAAESRYDLLVGRGGRESASELICPMG